MLLAQCVTLHAQRASKLVFRASANLTRYHCFVHCIGTGQSTAADAQGGANSSSAAKTGEDNNVDTRKGRSLTPIRRRWRRRKDEHRADERPEDESRYSSRRSKTIVETEVGTCVDEEAPEASSTVSLALTNAGRYESRQQAKAGAIGCSALHPNIAG